jgi:hypothetical protein
MDAINREGDKKPKMAIKGPNPEDSSAPTD